MTTHAHRAHDRHEPEGDLSMSSNYKPTWRERADMVNDGDFRILGEDEWGDLYVPSLTREDWWDRRFCWWKPSHWPYYVRSRMTARIAWLEREA